MQILWLSWRDIKNPDAGGAEKVAIEVASRFIKDKIPVTIFTSRFPNAKGQEIIRGVKIIRRGGLITCRLFAFLYYIRRTHEFDLIIDEINTIPFFSILYARSKIITLIHQLAKEYWFKQTFWPVNILGYLLESPVLRLYKSSLTIALGTSTENDLKNIGFTQVKTYMPGIDFNPQHTTQKENLILFLGRLIPAKEPDHAINAFKIIHKSFPKVKLIIAGRGKEKYVQKLKNLIKKLSLQKAIDFKGYVTEKEKINLLKKSKIMLIPSIREGWGLVVIEANATSCVPVAYNIPGLRDSIQNGQNGLLVNNNPQALATSVLLILNNGLLRKNLIEFGYNWSKKFTWEKCYRDFKAFILNEKLL